MKSEHLISTMTKIDRINQYNNFSTEEISEIDVNILKLTKLIAKINETKKKYDSCFNRLTALYNILPTALNKKIYANILRKIKAIEGPLKVYYNQMYTDYKKLKTFSTDKMIKHLPNNDIL